MRTDPIAWPITSPVASAIEGSGDRLTYVKPDRVLDLTSEFTSADASVADQSAEGNNATLYSGRFVSTDGVADKAVNADCSSLGTNDWKLTGKVRTTGGNYTFTFGDWNVFAAPSAANVWEDFELTLSSFAAGDVILGYSVGGGFTAADWSDVKLINTTTGEIVAHWQLNESAAGNLDGYPALDSSGNGYHGTHTGCAGGTGEGIDADVVGAAFAANEDKMYFDGVDDWVDISTFTTSQLSGGELTFSGSFLWSGGPEVVQGIITNGNTTTSTGFFFWINGTDFHVRVGDNTGTDAISITSAATEGVLYSYVLSVKVTGTLLEVKLYLNGVLAGSDSSSCAETNLNYLAQDWRIGFGNTGSSRYWKGVLYDTSIFDGYTSDGDISALTLISNYSGTELVTWTDTIGSNNGTVNGSPVTVGQKRETILQTAGMDWNKRMVFDGSTASVTIGDIAAFEINDFGVEFTAVPFSSGLGTFRYLYTQQFQVTGSDPSGWAVRFSDANKIQLITALGTGFELVTTTSSYTDAEPLLVNVSKSGTAVTITVNGVTAASGTLTSSTIDYTTALAKATAIGVSGTTFEHNGLIYDIATKNGSGTILGSWNGYGAGSNNWADQTGSNNGTVVGSPSAYLIPESDSTAGEDALGNAIANPRPTSDTFNGFSASEYLQLPDTASLETVRSITVAIYNDGTTRDFVQAAGGASFVHSASNVLTTDQTGTHAYYVNGAATTTLEAGWNVVGITFDAGKDLSGGKCLFQNAKLLAYDPTALTADEQLQNFNAFKSKFGL